MAGHYIFGARTGGAIVVYGCLYLVAGIFFAGSAQQFMALFPLPVLGVILLFESVALIRLMRDVASSPGDLTVAAVVGLVAFGLPYGYLIGMIAGGVLSRMVRESESL
jgi:hypothetical protein